MIKGELPIVNEMMSLLEKSFFIHHSPFIVLVTIVVICIIVAGAVWLVGRQMGIHRWDDSQVPVISVSGGLRPVIAFTPGVAYELNVYKGSEDGDGFGVLWSARGPGGYENNLHSPVTYGLPPQGSDIREAPPLEPEQTYTIVIFRKDPRGSGDGFVNTRHRYVGQETFVPLQIRLFCHPISPSKHPPKVCQK
jgi:hypothetical protein